jgi:Uma2 family endonuclease
MVALAKLPLRMTVDEFLAWDSGDDLHYELVDGTPRAMAPTTTIHGALQSELGRLIGNHLRESGRTCRVITNAGVKPNVLSAHNVRIPGLAVTCAPLALQQSILPEPILIIEILSPSNQADTWSNVWAYTSIPGLQEILILHSDKVSAEVLRRARDGTWPERTDTVTEGALTLASIDLPLPIAELHAGKPLAR